MNKIHNFEYVNLNEKHKKFCREYLKDLNGTNAAIRAGYSKKTAHVQASRLLNNAKVSEYVAELRTKEENKFEISREKILKELSAIAFFDIRKIFTVDSGLKGVHEFGDEEAAAVAGIESYDEREPDSGMVLGTTRKVKIHNKIQALERLSKMLGYDAPEKHEHTGKDGKPIETETKITHVVNFKKAGK